MSAERLVRHVVQGVSMIAAVAMIGLCPLAARAEAVKNQEHKMGHGPSSMAQLMKMSPEECMQMMDKGHKGFITKKDFMKFQEDLWKKMDKNHDGKVTTPEFTDAG